jgi:hypothetical protein
LRERRIQEREELEINVETNLGEDAGKNQEVTMKLESLNEKYVRLYEVDGVEREWMLKCRSARSSLFLPFFFQVAFLARTSRASTAPSKPDLYSL